jgi:hypothetical protein
MGNKEILNNRINRLLKIAQDAKEQFVILEMREKDGEDVADDRTRLEELTNKNKNAFDNTVEALEKLEELAQESE